MRQFNPLKEGLTPEALEVTYNILLEQKLRLEAKLERLEKELAVASCAIEDGLINKKEVKTGMLNLIAYIQASKTDLKEELDDDKGSLEILKSHLERVKEQIKRG